MFKGSGEFMDVLHSQSLNEAETFRGSGFD